MPSVNSIVSWLLRSPLHSLLSGSVDLVRYRGRRSGHEFVTPTQYARSGDDIVILVGHPYTKTWWRNFRTDHSIDVLVQGTWHHMTGRAVEAVDEPAVAAPLLDAYLAKFPKVARSVGSAPVVVWCRPR